jgi:hypothetical protein
MSKSRTGTTPAGGPSAQALSIEATSNINRQEVKERDDMLLPWKIEKRRE